MNIYTELYNRVEKHVKFFRGDLDHDKEVIESVPGKPFIHMATETGTHLKLLDYPHVDGVWVSQKRDYYPDGVFHYYNGEALCQLK